MSLPYPSYCNHGYTGRSKDHAAKGLVFGTESGFHYQKNEVSHEQEQAHMVKGQFKGPPGLETVPLPM